MVTSTVNRIQYFYCIIKTVLFRNIFNYRIVTLLIPKVMTLLFEYKLLIVRDEEKYKLNL